MHEHFLEKTVGLSTRDGFALPVERMDTECKDSPHLVAADYVEGVVRAVDSVVLCIQITRRCSMAGKKSAMTNLERPIDALIPLANIACMFALRT